jgi:RNA polymerase sigma-70 factor (ECF subfamily)
MSGGSRSGKHAGVRRSPPSGTTNETLLALVAGGDAGAFAELYGRQLPFVRGVLAARLQVRGPALEDLAQDVFLDVWRCAARFCPQRASAQTWLRTIADRRGIDHGRRARGAPTPTAEIADVPAPVDIGWDDRIDLADAVGGLAEARRRVIELVYWGGLTYPEVADATSAPLGTAKSRARLALRDLGHALGPQPAAA